MADRLFGPKEIFRRGRYPHTHATEMENAATTLRFHNSPQTRQNDVRMRSAVPVQSGHPSMEGRNQPQE